jgi:endonuclease YncB( thermonuclease family)
MLKSFCLWLRLCSSITGHAYIIDGDTVIVQGYHVRLHGIDAEELNEPNGLKAKAMMQFIIGSNQVNCNLNGEKSYDRYVGTCYVKGIDLGIAMVAAGYALDCAHYSHGMYRQFEPSDARKHLIQKPYC